MASNPYNIEYPPRPAGQCTFTIGHGPDEKCFLCLRLNLFGWMEVCSAMDFAKAGHGRGEGGPLELDENGWVGSWQSD